MIRFRRILCPVDFFPASERALTYAAKLAAKDKATLRLLHVVPILVPTAYDFPENLNVVTGKLEDNARDRIKALVDKLGLSNRNVHIEVTRGDVPGQIRKAIQTFKPDLVAMGTHGHRGFQRWILGSTTERLLRQSPVPVLAISAADKGPARPVSFRRIFVTTDFSKGTGKVLKYALSIAQENQSHITLLNVLSETRALTSAAYRKEEMAKAETQLAKLIPSDVQNWCDADTAVVAGTPYDVILKVVKKDRADLLVMGTHGKGMLDRALLGSTAERVVKAATCPVLLVPIDKPKK